MSTARDKMLEFKELPSDLTGAIYLAICDQEFREQYHDNEGNLSGLIVYYPDGSYLKIHVDGNIKAFSKDCKLIKRMRIKPE